MYIYLQQILDKKIREVCPIIGISIGRYNEKKTWRIDYDDSATLEQKQAAYEVMVNFVWNEKEEEKAAEASRIENLKHDPNMKAGYILYVDTHPNATFEDYLKYIDGIEI